MVGAMRILFTIPHYFRLQPRGEHASLGTDPQPRVIALTACLAALRQVFGPAQRWLQIANNVAVPANQQQAAEIEIVVCTTRGQHLLDQLRIPSHWYRHLPTDAE